MPSAAAASDSVRSIRQSTSATLRARTSASSPHARMISIDRRLSTVARGMRGEPRAALDERHGDAVARELDRRGETGRAGADDEHWGVGGHGVMVGSGASPA